MYLIATVLFSGFPNHVRIQFWGKHWVFWCLNVSFFVRVYMVYTTMTYFSQNNVSFIPDTSLMVLILTMNHTRLCEKESKQTMESFCPFLLFIGVFNPNLEDPLPGQMKKQLVLKIISGQQLPKPKDSMLGDRGEVGHTHTHILVFLYLWGPFVGYIYSHILTHKLTLTLHRISDFSLNTS